MTRHLPHCNVSRYDFPRKKPRVSPSLLPPQSRRAWPVTYNPRKGEVAEKDSTEGDDIGSLVLDTGDVDTCVGTPAYQAPSTSPRHGSPWSGEREEPSNPPSIDIVRKGILSTSSRVRVETFSEVSGRRAGRGYDIDDVNLDLADIRMSSQPLDEDGGEYKPFASAHDYALA